MCPVEQAEEKRKQHKTVPISRREVSLCPPPDYRLQAAGRHSFMEAVRDICESAYRQSMNCEQYHAAARANRERIYRERVCG